MPDAGKGAPEIRIELDVEVPIHEETRRRTRPRGTIVGGR